MTISIPDFLAVEDLLDDTIEEAEHLSASDAVDVILAVEKLAAKCREAVAALNGGLLNTLEGSIVREGHEFRKVPAGQQVYDHDAVARRVALIASCPDDDGVVPTAHRAAAEAARMMKILYTSASTTAKVGGKGKHIGLVDFGIEPSEVRDFVGEGTFKISKTPTTTPEVR